MLESFVKESSKNFLQVIENEQVCSKSHLDKPLKPLKIRNAWTSLKSVVRNWKM